MLGIVLLFVRYLLVLYIHVFNELDLSVIIRCHICMYDYICCITDGP